jgi:hypothetical protein
MQPPNAPKRHHYLPEFYLRGFAPEGALYVYDRADKAYRKQTPKNTAVESHFYTIENEDGERSAAVEELLAQIDGAAANAIAKVIAREVLSDDDRANLAVFVVLLRSRTPDYEKGYREMTDKVTREMTRLAYPDEAAVAEDIRKFEQETGKKLDVPPAIAFEMLHSQDLMYVPHRNETIGAMLRLSTEVAPVFAEMTWTVLHAPPKRSYLTSDAPFVTYPPRGWDPQGLMGVGLLTPGVENVVPLTSKVALAITHGDKGVRHLPASDFSVQITNHGVARRSDRYIISPSEKLLRSVVRRAAAAEQGKDPRVVVN